MNNFNRFSTGLKNSLKTMSKNCAKPWYAWICSLWKIKYPRRKNVAVSMKIYDFNKPLTKYSQSTGMCGKVRFLQFSLNFAFATDFCRKLRISALFSTFCSFLSNSFSTGWKMPKNPIKSRVYGGFQQIPQPLLFTITNIYLYLFYSILSI